MAKTPDAALAGALSDAFGGSSDDVWGCTLLRRRSWVVQRALSLPMRDGYHAQQGVEALRLGTLALIITNTLGILTG